MAAYPTCGCDAVLHRDVDDAIANFGGLQHVGDEFKVADGLANRDMKLPPVDEPRKRLVFLAPGGGNCEKVHVEGEEDTIQVGCPFKQPGVVPLGSTIFRRCHAVNALAAEARRDGRGNVMIHVVAKHGLHLASREELGSECRVRMGG